MQMNPSSRTWIIPLAALALTLVIAASLVLSRPDWWIALQGWVVQQQLAIQGELGSLTRQGETAALALIGLSFTYGVLHSVGPGHGKVVIATYAAATRATAKRVAWLSFTASLVQALGAVLLVYGGILLFEFSARWATRTAETVLLPISYGAIAVIGIYMLWRGWCFWREADHIEHEHDHHHDHDHHHAHDHHHHHDEHDHGHTHAPPPEAVQAANDWRAQLGIVLAIGIRPCTGALLVLALAWGVGAAWTGLAAALAMGVGTGVTVAILALMAVGAREVALKLVVFDTATVGRIAGACAMAGGTIIAAFAISLLWEALNRPVHPFLS